MTTSPQLYRTPNRLITAASILNFIGAAGLEGVSLNNDLGKVSYNNATYNTPYVIATNILNNTLTYNIYPPPWLDGIVSKNTKIIAVQDDKGRYVCIYPTSDL